MHHRQRNEAGGEEQLVREGVQHFPESRPLIGDTGDGAIERIRQPGDEEGRQGIVELLIVQQTHIDRDQQNAQDREAVGNIHVHRIGWCLESSPIQPGNAARTAHHRKGCGTLSTTVALQQADPYNRGP